MIGNTIRKYLDNRNYGGRNLVRVGFKISNYFILVSRLLYLWKQTKLP